jgi:hypothetical protein
MMPMNGYFDVPELFADQHDAAFPTDRSGNEVQYNSKPVLLRRLGMWTTVRSFYKTGAYI